MSSAPTKLMSTGSTSSIAASSAGDTRPLGSETTPSSTASALRRESSARDASAAGGAAYGSPISLNDASTFTHSAGSSFSVHAGKRMFSSLKIIPSTSAARGSSTDSRAAAMAFAPPAAAFSASRSSCRTSLCLPHMTCDGPMNPCCSRYGKIAFSFRA